MLKGISPILTPDLLKVLAEMGHGDELVIGDCNFPAASMGQRCVRQDGQNADELLNAILDLFPLDTYVEAPVSLMQVMPGDPCKPTIWATYHELADRHEGREVPFEMVERFAFYDRAKTAYAIVASGESALYANIILRKGVVK